MELSVEPKKTIKILSVIVCCLALFSVIGQFYKYFLGHDRLLVTLFNLDMEWNIPTWYASMTLLFCSFLLAIIAFAQKQTDTRELFLQWIVLSIIFLFLAMDEAIQFHEMIIEPLRSLLGAKGIFYFSWVIPASAFLLIFVLSYLKFLITLPSKTKKLFIISGVLYVGGALGMEFIGGYYADRYGQENIIYSLLTNVEELLEMSGIIIFIFALMSHIALDLKELRICIR